MSIHKTNPCSSVDEIFLPVKSRYLTDCRYCLKLKDLLLINNGAKFHLADLTAEGFEKLLMRLDANPARAAERYESLRLKLVKFYSWRGCPDANADELADETINRVAVKLEEEIEIESLNAYACQISRFVWLEFSRKRKEDNYGDEMPEQAIEPEIPNEPDERLKCLKKCLAEVAGDAKDRELIIGYYDRDAGEKQKEARKTLAEKFGLKMNALKVKACRLRAKLEKCINDCVGEM